ncbi:MAG: saccharopine dehydrogenase NADP-binding domain-containing protein [Acidimicrobiaceae bacterium]|nr:saccharopine dehydrogenase NADP-binding domain-containing protein [Acidimicrobiaceae bacterium]
MRRPQAAPARVIVFGAGATGARVVRMLAESPEVGRVEVRDPDTARLRRTVDSCDDSVTAARGLEMPPDADMVVIATPTGTQAAAARAAVNAGASAVTTSSEISETRELLALGSLAAENGVALVVGAGFMPGLTCLLARAGAAEFDLVDEIHVAKAGTGGPACARQHHRALSSLAIDWRDGSWTRRSGGSGRELCWFPDPVAGRDCYRGALSDALLLVPAFEGVERVTARLAATRRDRLTAPLPMMRRPHPEGGVGAVRVELRGRRAARRHVAVLGAQARPAQGAAIVAAATALHLIGRADVSGAGGLASIRDTGRLLRAVADRGLRPCRFEGFTLSRDETPRP